MESLTEGIKKSLKSSNSFEQYLSTRVAALYAIYLGTNAESFYKSIYESLDALLRIETTSIQIKAEVYMNYFY